MKAGSQVTALAVLLLGVGLGLQARNTPDTQLDSGFHRLYNLDFSGAQQEFAAYQQQRTDDPMGPVSQAAGLLFQELNRLGVLESQFFVHDSKFKARPQPPADPAMRRQFNQALAQGEALARSRLSRQPNSPDTLLALTLVYGLRADYAALIDKSNMEALHHTRDATQTANRLLAICPSCYDAYVATGISNYLVGSLSAPARLILRIGGYAGDKERGMEELRLAAEHGRYLAPFARILLAIAYQREHRPQQARRELSQLHEQFPQNDLITRELARLQPGGD